MNQNFRVLAASAGFVCALGTQALGQTVPSAVSPSDADKAIVAYVAMDSAGEILLANVALSKTQSAPVRTFAQRMIADHTKSMNDAKSLAAEVGATVDMKPSEDAIVSAAHLEKYSGHQFDVAFLSQEKEGHMGDIDNLRHEMEVSQSDAVKAFDQRNLHVDESHVTLLETTWDEVAQQS